MILDLLLSVLVLLGAGFTLVGSVALARLPDFLARLHGPTKATTLGLGCLLIVSSVWFSVAGAGLSLHEALIAVFLFLSAPVSAHLLGKAALHLRLPSAAALPPPPEATDDHR